MTKTKTNSDRGEWLAGAAFIAHAIFEAVEFAMHPEQWPKQWSEVPDALMANYIPLATATFGLLLLWRRFKSWMSPPRANEKVARVITDRV